MAREGRPLVRHALVTKNIALLVASTTLGKLSALVITAVMARALGAVTFGLYSFALALANFLSLIPSYGFNPLDCWRESTVCEHTTEQLPESRMTVG
jgi:hypothetical protein